MYYTVIVVRYTKSKAVREKKMLKKIFLAVTFSFLCGGSASALEGKAFDPRLAGSAVYSDPGFQDFIETAYGYLNPLNRLPVAVNYRDAVASPAATPKKAARAAMKAKTRPILRTGAKRACRSSKCRLNHKKIVRQLASAR